MNGHRDGSGDAEREAVELSDQVLELGGCCFVGAVGMGHTVELTGGVV